MFARGSNNFQRLIEQNADISSAVSDYLIEHPPGGVSLGETSLTAYRGDRGKNAYDHSLIAHAPANSVSLDTVKSDSEIGDAITKRHSNSPDHSHSNKTILDSIQEALTSILKGNYDTAYNHSGSSHAPANAQKNSDITKAEIEAKLTGVISSHSHAGGGSDGEVSVVLTQEQGTNSASFVNVTGLQFDALANSIYIIEFFLIFQSNSTSYGIGYGITGPASPVSCVGHVDLMLAASTRYVNNITGYDAVNGYSGSVVAINTDYPGYVWALLKTGNNGGTVYLRQRSESTSGTVKTMAGSTLRYRKVL